jgi:hypothetical protein
MMEGSYAALRNEEMIPAQVCIAISGETGVDVTLVIPKPVSMGTLYPNKFGGTRTLCECDARNSRISPAVYLNLARSVPTSLATCRNRNRSGRSLSP